MLRLEMTYPDGHVEEIEQEFSSVEEAKKYGYGLLAQIGQTEKYHYAHGDYKGIQARGKAKFMVLRKTRDGSEVAFDSTKE